MNKSILTGTTTSVEVARTQQSPHVPLKEKQRQSQSYPLIQGRGHVQRHEKVLEDQLWLQQLRLENSQSSGIRRKVLGVNNDYRKPQTMISQKTRHKRPILTARDKSSDMKILDCDAYFIFRTINYYYH